MNFNEARSYCTSQGGDLASISGTDEKVAILSSQILQGSEWLVGLYRTKEGWSWMTDDPFISDWSDNEPQVGVHCAKLKWDHNRWKLFGSDCNTPNKYICKYRGKYFILLI